MGGTGGPEGSLGPLPKSGPEVVLGIAGEAAENLPRRLILEYLGTLTLLV